MTDARPIPIHCAISPALGIRGPIFRAKLPEMDRQFVEFGGTKTVGGLEVRRLVVRWQFYASKFLGFV